MIYLAPNTYNSTARMVARGIKSGNMSAIRDAAAEMACMIPQDAVLVPMPSHFGFATTTLKLCEVISRITGSPVYDILKGKERETLYTLKKSGMPVRNLDLGFYTTADLPEDRTVVVIDNVIDTGTTAKAAITAIGRGIILAYARTSKTKHG